MMKGMNMIGKGIVAMIVFLILAGAVMAGNEQPVALATFSPQGCLACECKMIVLDGSGSSDKDGQIVSYDWYYYDADNNLKFIASGKIISLGKEFCDNPGTYRNKLVVTDNSGATDDYDFQFIIKSNPAPMIKEIKIINAKDFYVFDEKISVSVILNSLGRGSSYGKLNYFWDYDSKVFQKNGNGKEITFKVISSKVFQTNYKIGVEVSNACGMRDQRKEIEIEVRSLQSGSSLETEIILPPVIYEGKRFRAESSYKPEPGNEIKYLWNLYKVLNGKELPLKPPSEKEEPSFVVNDWGVYNITLEITDRYGAKGSAFKIFEANNSVNDKPTADASATKRQVLQGEEILLNGSLSRDPDPDGIEFYCWFDKSYEEDLGCSESPALKAVFNRSGPHKIILTVKDNGLPRNKEDFLKHLSDTDTVMINVVKSASPINSKVSGPAIATPLPTPTTTSIKIDLPASGQPPPPKESNEIPGMEAGMTIAMIIIAIAMAKEK